MNVIQRLILIFLIIISGCDWNQSSTQSSEVRRKSTNTPQMDTKSTTNVVALCGAWVCHKVWLDTNGNREQDDAEPSSTVNADGEYNLISRENINEHNLLAVANTDGGKELILMAPPGVSVVSPFTTMVSANLAMGSLSDQPITIDTAHAILQKELELEDIELLVDYRNAENKRVSEYASAISRVLLRNWQALDGHCSQSAITALASQWVYNHLALLKEGLQVNQIQYAIDNFPTLIAIPPAPTGRAVIYGYEGIPAGIREHLPKYTNAYISEVASFDYRKGIAILATDDVTDHEVLRTRDVVNAMLLAIDVREVLAEYQGFIGITKTEPSDGLLDALLKLRPIELIYTDLEGDGSINEVGLNGEPEATTHHILQLFAYYAFNNAANFTKDKQDLLAAYKNAIDKQIYTPEAKYLKPDFAHPGILTAPGAYLALAVDAYFEIIKYSGVEDTEYPVASAADMKVKDPFMFTFIQKNIHPDWFNYDAFVRPESGYLTVLQQLEESGLLDQYKDGAHPAGVLRTSKSAPKQGGIGVRPVQHDRSY